ncbi:MAG TPA: tetratricopeptide repeat protein, partial [Casimicrobiaceae bacterium]|nr:tetratricopeptide repeat protein [Casimicrobiaceae bacterium]
PLVYLRLAQAQVALKDYAGAIDSERKALALKPDLPQAVSALAQTYLLSGRADEAVAQARGM